MIPCYVRDGTTGCRLLHGEFEEHSLEARGGCWIGVFPSPRGHGRYIPRASGGRMIYTKHKVTSNGYRYLSVNTRWRSKHVLRRRLPMAGAIWGTPSTLSHPPSTVLPSYFQFPLPAILPCNTFSRTPISGPSLPSLALATPFHLLFILFIDLATRFRKEKVSTLTVRGRMEGSGLTRLCFSGWFDELAC